MANGTPVPRSWSAFRWGLLAVLLLAAGLRYWALPSFPWGIEHDEVAEVLIAEAILQGEHAIYFEEAYGQEPLFLYLVAVSRALVGRNVLALRFVSASVGLLTVAAVGRLGWRMFNERAALVAAAGVAVTLWAVFWSRVGLRGMLLPLTMSLGAEALWATLKGRQSLQHGTFAGIWFGLSAYTYLAARGVPLMLGGLLVLLMLFDRRRLSRRWCAIVLALGIAAVLAAPLVGYLSVNTAAQTRVYEVDAPLRALLDGDPGPVLSNLPRVLGMFAFRGDATARNNLPGRPVFAGLLPVSAWGVLFIGGLVVALVRLGDPRHGLLWIWLLAMASPSLVTIEAPNFVRTLGALPAVMLALAVGAETVWRLLRPSPRWLRGMAAFVFVATLGANLAATVRDYFVRWPQNPEVAFVWQWDFVAVANWLDAHPAVTDVTVAGLSVLSMDAPSLDLLMQRDDVAVRWCDPGSPIGAGGAVLYPAQGGSILVPSVVPVADALANLTGFDSGGTDEQRFVRYPVSPPDPRVSPLAVYEGGTALLGVELPPGPVAPGQTLTLLSTWKALDDVHSDLKAFVHVLDETGALRAQHDGLDCPAQFWRAGDVIVQLHKLTLPADLAPGPHMVSIGLYDRQTLAPYPLLDGSASFEVGTLEIADV